MKKPLPTNIYWLVDTRTGVPFYCGKTITSPQRRLVCHFGEATRAPNRPVLRRIVEIGENSVRIDVIEIVPYDGDWEDREKYWISTLRLINPNCANVSSGGAGAPGLILSDATRNKMSKARQGRTVSIETRSKIRAATGKRMKCPKQRAHLSVALKSRVFSPETLLKMSAGQKARFAKNPLIHSPETRAKMSVTAKRNFQLRFDAAQPEASASQ